MDDEMPPGLSFGLDVLVDSGFAAVAGKRVGLVTHTAARTRNNRSSVEAFAAAGNLELAALFGPEHGLTAEAQDLEGVPGAARDPLTGLPVYSLYGETFESLRPTPDMLRGLDVLVIDLQDVGARYYTFQATMLYCMEAAAAAGLPVVVLDRTNPLNRAIEGPTVRPGFESFVGVHSVPTCHGMTIGELARLYRAERVPACDLTVISEQGDMAGNGWSWERDWLPPSPNMPTLDTVAVYPGMCLIEGTNLSEGRGTTRPFEYVGFPGVDPYRLVDRLRSAAIPQMEFLPVQFRPTFQKHAGRTCGGVFIIPRAEYQPVRTGLAVLCAFRDLLGDAFRWRTETYEFVSHIPAIDLLFGSDRERLAIEAGVPWREIAAAWEPEEEAFRERRKPYLLYPE
jgi:uncharacterized protein YbbC (DUF1343 family)